MTAYSQYYNYHRLHGELGWRTPAERFDGTPFTDRGFEHVPALAGVAEHPSTTTAEVKDRSPRLWSNALRLQGSQDVRDALRGHPEEAVLID